MLAVVVFTVVFYLLRLVLQAIAPALSAALLGSASTKPPGLVSSGEKEVAALLASSAVALMAPDLEPERGQRVIERSRLPERAAAFDRAAAAYRTDESDGEDAAT